VDQTILVGLVLRTVQNARQDAALYAGEKWVKVWAMIWTVTLRVAAMIAGIPVVVGVFNSHPCERFLKMILILSKLTRNQGENRHGNQAENKVRQ